MTATCPRGHASATTDYCDQCGARIEAAPVALPDHLHADTGSTPVTSTSPVNAPCPHCGVPRAGRDRFCESCGHDFTTAPGAPTTPAQAGWTAHVAPDRDYFDRVATEGLTFPDDDERTVALEAERVRIGRRRAAGDDAPEIELADPAVSRLHATLRRGLDGAWAVVDEGSSNGTTINAATDPIAPHAEVPLAEGDRVHVGAWTTITLAVRSRVA